MIIETVTCSVLLIAIILAVGKYDYKNQKVKS